MEKYEKYRDWMTPKTYGYYWWVLPTDKEPFNEKYYLFRYRFGMKENSKNNMNSQYVFITQDGYVEMGEFSCLIGMANFYRFKRFSQCNFENTPLKRVWGKKYSFTGEALNSLLNPKSLISKIIDINGAITIESAFGETRKYFYDSNNLYG